MMSVRQDYEELLSTPEREAFESLHRKRREKPVRTRSRKKVAVSGIHHRRRKHFSW